MAYGLTSGYGVNGGGEGDAGATQTQDAPAFNPLKQRQRQFGAQNGMALAEQEKKRQTSTAYSRGTAASPVTGDGKINEANGTPPAAAAGGATGSYDVGAGFEKANQPGAAAPAAAPTRVERGDMEGWTAKGIDFNKLPGSGTAVPGQPGMEFAHDGQGWVIRPTGGGAAPTPGTTPMPGTAPVGPAQWSEVNTKLGEHGLPGRPANTFYTPGTLPQYTGGAWGGGAISNDPLATYGGSKFSQYQGVDQNSEEGQIWQALQGAINGPGPIDAEKLKARSKDSTLAMQQQLLQDSRNSAAARGLSGGGADAAAQGRVKDNAVREMLGNYRDIDIDAASKNRTALMDALTKGSDFLTGQVTRRTNQFDATNKGQTSIAGDKKDVVDSKNTAIKHKADIEGKNIDYSKDQWESGIKAHETALKSALGQEGLDQISAEMASGNFSEDTKAMLTKLGINVDNLKANISKEVGMAGVGADIYGSKLSALVNLLGISETARGNDQNTGTKWGSILSNAIGGL